MNQHVIPDAFAHGYLAHKTLSQHEKIAYGLLCSAQNTEISFSDAVLPIVQCTPPGAGCRYHFGNGIEVFYDLAKQCKDFPDAKAKLAQNCAEMTKEYSSMTNWQTGCGLKISTAGAGWGGGWGGHGNPDYARLLTLGTTGIRTLIEQNSTAHPESADFYRGCAITMDAIDTLAMRAAVAAKEEAAAQGDSERRMQLLQLSQALEHAPKYPATTFLQGIAAFFLVFTFEGVDSPGRFDRYLGTLYEQEEASVRYALLGRLWDAFHTVRAWNLTISGSDAFWNDQTNTLSYDILRIAAEKRYQTPNLTARVHRNTPQLFWKAIAATLSTGSGLPAIYSDEVVCPALEKIGIPSQDSHDYCLNGCNQIEIMGKGHMGLEDGEVNFAKCLEFALWDGKDTLNGEQISIHTGDAARFTSYDAVETAFLQQLTAVTEAVAASSNAHQAAIAAFSPNPLRSCLTRGCLEKGKDYRNGGPLYNHGEILAEGIADAADSLRAIQQVVFEEHCVTMQELLQALSANFVGYEPLQRKLASCEKFGNDIDGVDRIAARITAHFLSILKQIPTYRGGIFTGGCSPYDRAAENGRHTGALPEGRCAREALFADSIGAVPGQDVNGPTALLCSALKYPQGECGSGFILNLKFDKTLFNSTRGQSAFIALAKTYLFSGGQTLTATVVSKEELLDAKVHPERHRDLIVRVGGYSDYFTNLEAGLQDNVIARSELTV